MVPLQEKLQGEQISLSHPRVSLLSYIKSQISLSLLSFQKMELNSHTCKIHISSCTHTFPFQPCVIIHLILLSSLTSKRLAAFN